jgi:predicted PurR-regulated permease PerM
MRYADTVRLSAVLAVTVLGVYLCYLLATPFLPAIVWSLVLVAVIHPVHQKLEKVLGAGDAAALLSVLFAVAVVCVPLLLLAQQLIREAANGAVYLEATIRNWTVDGLPEQSSALTYVVRWVQTRFDPAGSLAAVTQWLTAQSASLLRGSFNQAVTFVLTFYLLFYFLRDRRLMLAALCEFSPLSRTDTSRLMNRIVDTIHATLVGTLVVAAVQGTLGGIMFWWLGLPAPVFWGAAMGMLAIVPVLGAFVIWVPASIYLAAESAWLDAALLAAWGGVIIAGIDNLLYPMLVGNKLKLHTLAAFIGAVGGIILFGASGIVLGPAAIAVTASLVDILKDRLRWKEGFPDDDEVAAKISGGFQ